MDPSLRAGTSETTCASQDLTGAMLLTPLVNANGVRERALSFHQELQSRQRVSRGVDATSVRVLGTCSRSH